MAASPRLQNILFFSRSSGLEISMRDAGMCAARIEILYIMIRFQVERHTKIRTVLQSTASQTSRTAKHTSFRMASDVNLSSW